MMNSIKFSITTKLTAFILILVTFTALAVSFVYSAGSENILIDRAVNDLEQEIIFLQKPLAKPIEQMHVDIKMLSKLPPHTRVHTGIYSRRR